MSQVPPVSRPRLSRRRLLGSAAGVAGAALTGSLLSGCTGSGEPAQSPGPSGGGAETGTVQWWDQFRPLTTLFTKELFQPYADRHPGVTVERRELDAPALGQALQLARRSKQSPDVHSLAGLDSSPASLVGAGWFQPIDDFVDLEGSPIADQLLDGIHRFDGKLYSFPVFSGRTHDASPWLNTAQLETAGLDPAESPASWDDFRAALKTLKSKLPDGSSPIVLPGKVPGYLDALITRFAMAAGAAGSVAPQTGEYVYHSQPYLDAFEFLLSLHADGLVHPASASMDPRDARSRWAAGQAAVYPWGAWFIGGLKVQEPEAVERGVGVWRIPTPAGTPPVIYSAPPSGTFWVSAQAKLPKLGADVMFSMLEPEFMKKLAGAMDQPPILDQVVAEADVHPAYRANLEFHAQDVKLAPQPQVRNQAVSQALVELRPVDPDLGAIAQAVLTGANRDYAGALRTLSDSMTKERERAVKSAAGKGAQVSLEDWVFADWKPGEDYRQ
jgi:multiple sugar transport system substrate-binding protein